MWKSVEIWRVALRLRAFRDQFLIAVIALPITVVIMRVYLNRVEMRNGVVLPDPMLSIIPSLELNWVIFAVMYSGMLLGIVSLSLYPFRFLLMMRAFVLMIPLRIVCLFLLPLGPIPGGIPLVDPIVHFPVLRFASSHGLFFCWETATMVLLALTAQWKDMKMIFTSAAIVVSLLLLLQHAQYTIGIVAAPCFAYAAFGLARAITVRDIRELRASGRDEKPSAAGGRNM